MRSKTIVVRSLLGIAALALGAADEKPRPFPDGPGKEIVLERCGLCHSVNNAHSSDFGPEGWRNTLAQMRNVGAALTDEELETVARYLATASPPAPRPKAVLVPGPIRLRIKEWPVSLRGSMPRDPAVAPDGTVWFTGQFGNILIHLDPKTAQFTEQKVRLRSSGPMGLAIDAAGDLWFAANFRSYVGRMNPRTKTFTEYRLPGTDGALGEGNNLGLAGIVIGAGGMVWFTAEDGNFVGRIDPRTGALTKIAMPPDSAPFAIAVNSLGVPFVTLRETRAIARIDPATLAVTTFPIANPKGEPRRVAVTADGMVWYTDIDRGYLGRIDPKSGAVKEYASPSGPKSEPHAIAAAGNIVWYVENAADPNTLVRFDPARETFQSWPIPSGDARVRHLAITADGNVAMGMGGTNRIGLTEIAK